MAVQVIATFYFLAVLVAFLAMVLDKLRAKAGVWRTSESILLLLAVFGWPGAKAGQRLVRHKTTKQPFARDLNRSGFMHVVFWLGALVWRSL
jgi:uncharacterized membrane protein YsdA (DUF1294 family)